MFQTLQAWYVRRKVLTWVIAGLVIGYTLAGFVLTPMVVKQLLQGRVSKLIDRNVQVRKVRANPYTFSLHLFDLSIADRDGSAFADVGEIFVNLQPVASLFKWGVVMKTVAIKAPGLRLVRSGADRFNFSDLLAARSHSDKSDTAAEEKSLRLFLKHFAVEGGRIDFVDQASTSAFRSTLSSIDITIDRLDTQSAAEPAQYRISARSESDETLSADGQLVITPLDVTCDVSMEQLQIAKYAPYYGPLINSRITEGTIGLKGRIQWSAHRQALNNIQVALAQLAVTSAGDDMVLIHLPELSISDGKVDIKGKTIGLGRVTSRDGEVHAARNDQGEINLVTAFLPPARDAVVGAAPPAPSASGNTPTWVVHAPEVDVRGYSIQFADARVSPSANLKFSNVALNAKKLSTQRESKAAVTLNLNWADQGNLSLEGELGLIPFRAALAVAARDLDIRPLQPYLNDHLQLVVTKGNFTTEGQLQVVPQDADLDLQYSGQAAINDFQSVDPKQNGDFLKWKSLFLNGLEMGTVPFRLLVTEVALTDFFNRLIIFKDGSSNLQAILKGDRPKEPAESAELEELTASGDGSAEKAPDIRINTVTLQGGQVDFSDLFIKPNVRLPMSAIGGRISGLDAIKTHRADVLLRGRVNANVPMEIRGQINPLIAKPYVDLKLDFAGIDLSPFAPYSGKYLGYSLDKGQLSLDLSYLVADNKLTGQNKVLLKQLTLGESVPSETATKLPIKFAIALLKDGKGNIDLDLPVSGDLDSPEFSIGGIILKMLANLIVDIVTSPFKVLGALFGGGEELAYLDFEPGSADLPETGIPKLDSLTKILAERPGLNLEIQGQVDPSADIDGLRRIRFEQDLRSTKLKAMVAKGQTGVPLDQIALSPKERDKLIKKAYAAAKFPKPRDDRGKVKKLSPEEMEKLLYTSIALSDDDLRLLAHERASTAKKYLLENAQVKADRIYVIEPKIKAQEQDEALQRRVKFNLK